MELMVLTKVSVCVGEIEVLIGSETDDEWNAS